MSFSLTPAKLAPWAALPLLLAGLGCAQLRSFHRRKPAHPPAPIAAPPAAPEIDPNVSDEPDPAPLPPPVQKPVAPAKVTLDGAWLVPVAHGWKLGPKGLEAVRQIADRVQAYGPGLRVMVNGFTSATGTRAHNLVLSHQRAEVVEKALVQAGLAHEQVVARGFGPDKPIASNATGEGRLKNLRVEVEFQIR